MARAKWDTLLVTVQQQSYLDYLASMDLWVWKMDDLG